MWSSLVYAVQALAVFCCAYAAPTLRVTNVRCKAHNNLIEFNYCVMRPLSRDVQVMSVRASVKDLPITNATFVLQIYKKSNGYSPYNKFMSEISVDGCEFLAKRNNPVLNYLYKSFLKYSNLNHTCPYDHDIILEKMRLEMNIFEWIPFPVGEYIFKTKWYIKNTLRADVDFYFSYSER